MIYKFKSQAAADVIMLEANAEQVLRLLGRELAPQGIVTAADLGAAIATLERAVAEDEAAHHHHEDDNENHADEHGHPRAGVSLRQRVWPFVELLKYSQAAGEPVVWGV